MKRAMMSVVWMIGAASASMAQDAAEKPAAPVKPPSAVTAPAPAPTPPPSVAPAAPPAPMSPTPAPITPQPPPPAPAKPSAPPSEAQVLLQRVEAALRSEPVNLDAAAVRRRLDRIIDDAGQLAARTDDRPLRVKALSVQMQAIYGQLQRFPADDQAGNWLTKLRTIARRTKAVDDPAAAFTGDFWLTTAELVEIHRSDLTLGEKQQQLRASLEGFIAAHPASPPAAAVRNALEKLPPPPAAPGSGANRPAELINPAPKPTAPKLPPPPAPKPFELTPSPELDDGLARFELRSPHQPRPNVVRVLLPAKLKQDPSKLREDDGYRFLYVLPVEPGLQHKYGDGLATIEQMDLHNRFDLIVIAPAFSQLPWYADHASDPHIAQQRYFIESVVPAMERQYPMRHPRRLLVGFSKSGWGAVSLLLTRPKLFDAAGVFDAPLTVDAPVKYGMGPVFGGQENFEKYELTRRVRRQANALHQRPRLVLYGYGNFQQPMSQFHALLKELGVPHEYDGQTQLEHTWSSGWLGPVIEQLVKLTE